MVRALKAKEKPFSSSSRSRCFQTGVAIRNVRGYPRILPWGSSRRCSRAPRRSCAPGRPASRRDRSDMPPRLADMKFSRSALVSAEIQRAVVVGRRLEVDVQIIFRLHPRLQHVELQLADHAHDPLSPPITRLEHLGHAFLGEIVQRARQLLLTSSDRPGARGAGFPARSSGMPVNTIAAPSVSVSPTRSTP